MGSPNWQEGSTQTSVVVRTRRHFKTPEKFRVIFWNDDVTTFDFVIEVLGNIFNYDLRDAYLKALEIDGKGQAAVGIYIMSIAEAKRDATLHQAREQGFPLKVTIAPLA
ncbi:MAG: ATP-dependent Clp protease adaptor ClpS [Victivallales bacterium]|nr:ATP-dependent Clp protease adaptor ClpS [Victivallales bacterium]